jgi:hypothetical protein
LIVQNSDQISADALIVQEATVELETVVGAVVSIVGEVVVVGAYLAVVESQAAVELAVQKDVQNLIQDSASFAGCWSYCYEMERNQEIYLNPSH